jgi:hypothetical protein
VNDRFAELASAGCPPHGALALALAAEFHQVDLAGAESVLGELTDAIAPMRGAPALEQLAHCGREVGARLAARVRPGALGDLLLDRVLLTGAGDPVCWAIACVHAARHAGIPLGIVADDEDHVLVAHRDLEPPIVLEPSAPSVPIDAARLPAGDLTWRCSHQTALMLLDRIVVRGTRAGRHGDALRAAQLRLELPLEEATLDALREERDALYARLN